MLTSPRPVAGLRLTDEVSEAHRLKVGGTNEITFLSVPERQ
jgi:hypothetical protein